MNFTRRSLQVFVAVWLALICPQTASALEAPVRIMPLGDSITFGESTPITGVQGGYRNLLYTLLDAAGYNVDFVGTFSDTDNPGLPDRDHQGKPSYRVDEIDTEITGWLNEVEDPDVILLLIGTNDFLQTWLYKQPAGVLDELDALITKITTSRPHAKIIVSSLIPSTVSTDIEAKQVIFNQGIPDLVDQHVAQGHPVSSVNMHDALEEADLFDDIHPTPLGYEKMAQVWKNAIQEVIDPQGTSHPPMIARVGTSEDLTQVTVTFSKPVSDDAANLANFQISNGLVVSNAVLDPATKRTVTLTTSAQSPGIAYTLSVSGVLDRTSPPHSIAPQSKALFSRDSIGNGSFENQPLYSGWSTHTGNQFIFEEPGDPGDPPYAATAGTRLVVFNDGDQTPNAVLAQSFPTIIGQSYQLSFDLGTLSWNKKLQELQVKIDGIGNLLEETTSINGIGGTAALDWQSRTYAFIANSNSTTVTFTDLTTFANSTSIDMLLDNVRVAAQLNTTLAVTSTPAAGVPITLSPNDIFGGGSGLTGILRSYNAGTSVTVTAPATSSGGNFLKWQINGHDLPGTNPSITLTLNASTTLNAVYEPSAFTQWLAGRVTDAGVAADPDQDSISNAVEYVINGNPAGGTDAGLLPFVTPINPDPEAPPPSVGALVFTYRRNQLAANDPLTTIEVEWTTDPTGSWTAADGTHGEVIESEEDAAGPGIDLVHVSIPMAPSGRLFARLKITIDAPP